MTKFGMKGELKTPGVTRTKSVATAPLVTRQALGAEAMKALSTPKRKGQFGNQV